MRQCVHGATCQDSQRSEGSLIVEVQAVTNLPADMQSKGPHGAAKEQCYIVIQEASKGYSLRVDIPSDTKSFAYDKLL